MVVTDMRSIDGAPKKPRGRSHRVLLIAYHFPPDASSTGRLRTLAFAQHLPTFGWEPTVLAPSAMAYERTDKQGLADMPPNLRVCRTPALDARRHMGWRGRYLSLSAVPDRWISWLPGAVATGLALIRKQQIDAIWSTYPIATTHLVALTLARLTGLPWIADFRDPVVPAGTGLQRRAARLIEQRTLARASAVVFTTPGARARYAQRFPAMAAANKLHVVPNGFEESSLARQTPPELPAPGTPLRLVHSGLLYPEGRNPEPFFRALAQLKKTRNLSAADLQVTLRASGSEDGYQAQLDKLGVADMSSWRRRCRIATRWQSRRMRTGCCFFRAHSSTHRYRPRYSNICASVDRCLRSPTRRAIPRCCWIKQAAARSPQSTIGRPSPNRWLFSLMLFGTTARL